MYYERTLLRTLEEVSKGFKTVLLTGMRQTGKTTFLKHSLEKQAGRPKRTYVSLDNVADSSLANNDASLFFQTYEPPVLIDEVQYAPKLFRTIKTLVDAQDERGLVWMTGSQQYNLMAGVTESLAGRVAILELLGFSLYEREGKGLMQQPFLPALKPASLLEKRGLKDTYQIIWQGSFPDVVGRSARGREQFYSNYVRTYLERDIRQLINVENESDFMRFLCAAAARTGQELNLTDMSRDINVSVNTIKKWLSLLETSGVIYLLKPYYRNISKRLTKRPKLYFTDTGLCSYLTNWSSPETLERGAMSGAIFETFVVMEIIKSWYHNGFHPSFYYYRDSNKVEIDLLIAQDDLFYPIEIKKTANPVKNDVDSFDHFAHYEKIGYGALLCLTDHARPLNEHVSSVSIWDI
jgi:predicted AAA+ superfamily ATPase